MLNFDALWIFFSPVLTDLRIHKTVSSSFEEEADPGLVQKIRLPNSGFREAESQPG